MEITKELLRAFRADLELALLPLGAKYGLTIKTGACTYSREGTFDMKVSAIAEGGKSKEAQRYEANANLFNLPPLGTEVTLGGKKHKSTGLNTTASKVLLEMDGKGYTLPLDTYVRLTKAEATKA